MAAAAGIAGCGDVNSTVCKGVQDDTVACTVDVCNEDSTAWAHIPDNSLCDPGQRCDPKAGCVAAGALTGHAYLFAHTDHSGITVSIDGVEGASTMTDAKGDWSLSAVPTGTYTVRFTKDKYIAQAQTGVAVFPEAANSPDSVTLRHGADVGMDKSINYPINANYNFAIYTPDKKHVIQRYCVYPQGCELRAINLESTNPPVPLFSDPQYYGSVGFQITNTHIVWNMYGQTIWARPYDGGPAVILGTAMPNESISVAGTPGAYTVLQKQKYLPGPAYYENSLYVVKTDGSTPMGAAVWTTPDAQHNLDWVANNDTTAMFGVNDTTGSPPADAAAMIPLRRIDLATGTVTNVNTAFATYSSGVFSKSPDGTYLYGYLYQNSPAWQRAFLIPLSGTAGPSLAPDYGAANGMKNSDMNNGHVWLADNSGVVIQTSTYTTAANAVGEGHLKVWLTAQPTATLLATYNTYFNWTVHNKVVAYRDVNSVVSQLKVVTAHSTSPQTYTLDNSNTYLQDFAFNDTSPTSSYMVWTRSVSNGNSTRAQIYAVNMAQPLLAAPNVVQLGGTLANTCAYEGTLSDYTYWQLCQDTGVLSGFTQSTTTAGTQTQGVRGGLIPLPDADRIAFRKYDGKLYSSPNTGTLSEVKLVSTQIDMVTPVFGFDKWVMFRDANGAYTRASAADGSSIDEPLSTCRAAQNYFGLGPQVLYSPAKSHAWLAFLQCEQLKFGELSVPATNLP